MKWKENHDNDYYIQCFYQQVLDKLNPEIVYKELQHLSQGKDVVLLCNEQPKDFCHRHLVADWFNNDGITVSEWK